MESFLSQLHERPEWFLENCNPNDIRNVCMIAHVDHGKTSLCDHLISTNGILNNNSAGHVRYLDFRKDEQRRMITMKSSCITLCYQPPDRDDFCLINLIDSPGHIDFSCEVSSSVRLSDGALLLVDVVEGICAQTKQVAEKAFQDHLSFILVFNKMDKLFTELRMSPSDIFTHVSSLLNEINLLFSHFKRRELLPYLSDNEVPVPQRESSDDDVYFSPVKGNVIFCSANDGWAFDITHFAQMLSSKYRLSNRVLPKLTKALWGSYYLNTKMFSVTCQPLYPQQLPMVTQYIFDPLWKIYQWTIISPDREALAKAVTALHIDCDLKGISMEKHLIKTLMSKWLPLGKQLLSTIVHILPSPVQSIQQRITFLLPREADESQVSQSNTALRDTSWKSAYRTIRALKECTRDTSCPVVIYITKFLRGNMASKTLVGDTPGVEQDEDFVALARIFSGVLVVGIKLFLCRDTKTSMLDSPEETKHAQREFQIIKLFLLQGSDLLPIQKIEAGCIFAVQLTELTSNPICFNTVAPFSPTHSQQHTSCVSLWNQQMASTLHHSMTLSTNPLTPAFYSSHNADPLAIVSVHLEPERVCDFPLLLKGLLELYKSDFSVEIEVTFEGEIILRCCGEVHLEKSITDLEKVYARVPIKVSDPILSLRESLYGELHNKGGGGPCSKTLHPLSLSAPFPPWNIEKKPKIMNPDVLSNKRGVENITGLDMAFPFRISAEPLPGLVLLWMESTATQLQQATYSTMSSSSLRSLQSTIASRWKPHTDATQGIAGPLRPPHTSFFYDPYTDNPHSIPAGPPCGLLLGVCVTRGSRTLLYMVIENDMTAQRIPVTIQPFIGSILTGFQLASNTGPLTEEPLVGVAFTIFVQDVYQDTGAPLGQDVVTGGDTRTSVCSQEILPPATTELQSLAFSHSTQRTHASLNSSKSGQIISHIREVCRRAVLQRGRLRIFEAMLHLELRCQQDVLGKAYRVLSKRRSQILSEDVHEASTFITRALVPVSESFGLAHDLRSKASGRISLELQFSHWQVCSEEPFPETCLTHQDVEQDGCQTSKEFSIARRLIYEIRRRKGLATDDKVVTASTKQRTLTKNK